MRYGTSRIGRGCPSRCHGINDASHVVASWDDGHVDVLSRSKSRTIRFSRFGTRTYVALPSNLLCPDCFHCRLFNYGREHNHSLILHGPTTASSFLPQEQTDGKQLREARMARDTAMADKMQKIQLEMMPEQMKMQSSMMKPMVFTMVFIIAIFSWMAGSVESFRVGFVSLPWDPMWSFNARVLWIFPAWIATYIAMSAPLGRILDRHIKIVRFSRHPLVLSGRPSQSLFCTCSMMQRKSQHRLQLENHREGRDQGKQGGSKNIDQRRSGNKHVAPPERVQSARFAIPI